MNNLLDQLPSIEEIYDMPDEILGEAVKTLIDTYLIHCQLNKDTNLSMYLARDKNVELTVTISTVVTKTRPNPIKENRLRLL